MKKIFLFLFLIVVTGCNFRIDPNSDDSLFSQSVCEFPCWQGLTPGQSTLNEIKQQLQSIEFVNKTNLDESTSGNRTIFRWWHTRSQEQSRIITENELLSSIEIVPLINFTLENIIAIYGEPDVIGIRFEDFVRGSVLLKIYAVYPDIGAVFQYELLSEENSYLVESNIEGKKFYLFEPVSDLDQFIAEIDSLDGQRLRANQIFEWPNLPFTAVPNVSSLNPGILSTPDSENP